MYGFHYMVANRYANNVREMFGIFFFFFHFIVPEYETDTLYVETARRIRMKE